MSSRQYFEPDPSVPSDERTLRLDLPDVSFTLRSDAGVFAGRSVDPGTKYLLLEAPEPAAEVRTALDLGCGYGPIALTLAHRAPTATVHAVDVNARALDLCRRNAEAAGLANVTVGPVADNVAFDLIWSNPPIRIGKDALHELLTTWLDRLEPTGRAVLVVQKHLGSDSLARWLNESGWATERLGSRRGFRLLDVAARA